MQHQKKIRKIPKILSDQQSWQLNRRSFIKKSLLAGLIANVTMLPACFEAEDVHPLDKKQFRILQKVQSILFPNDDFGPGAKDFHADKYVLWVLNDKRMDEEENTFLLNGLDWTEESAIERFNKSFLGLDSGKQKELIAFISKESWGEAWLSIMLTYIFEAMISDPVYGFNDVEQGWKWLEHQVGLPRPDEFTKYDQIFATLKY